MPSGLPLPAATKRKVQIKIVALTIFKILLAVAVVSLMAFAYTLWGGSCIATRESEVGAVGKGGDGWSAGWAFWVGVGVTASLGSLGSVWFWGLFRTTLEYDKGFPAMIPRCKRI